MFRYILGFDIGGTKCAVNLARFVDGVELIDRLAFPTEADKGFVHVKDRLIRSARGLLARNNVEPQGPAAIGVSCGGPLDSARGLVLSPPNLPGWDNIPIVDILSDEFGVPAFLQNDANACALVEWKLGAGRGVKDMVFLTMGTGFGAGIIAGGKLVEGASCLAGEIGHVRLEPDGPVAWGKAGCVESFCGGAGMEAAYMGGVYTVKEIADLTRSGDAGAIGFFTETGRRLGKTLAILLDLLNPERIIIGSIFARCEDLLRPSMEAALKEEALPGTYAACRVLPAETGESIGDYAGILAACYRMGYDVTPVDRDVGNRAGPHLENLLRRYPALRVCERDILEGFYLLRSRYGNGGKLLVCGNGGSAADAGHIVGELMKGFLLRRKPDALRYTRTAPVASSGTSGEADPRPAPYTPSALSGARFSRLQGALPAIDLTQHNALSTAFCNDVDPELVYAQQVYGYGCAADVFMGISTSGNAKNVVEAAKTARDMGIAVITLTGAGGGALAGLSDAPIRVPSDSTPEIQELHLPVYHCLCAMLEAEFFGA